MDAMSGAPVWLASVSHSDKRGRIIGTVNWTRYDFTLAERIAHRELEGVGDAARERCFRMNITFCIHRAVSAEEIARLPKEWACAPGGLAGGPVEVLWSRGIEHKPASMPCNAPRHRVINVQRPDLWVPEDCGKCEPCLARAVIQRQVEEREKQCHVSTS
jgi:hypothetical protein